ncbi:unnamed protein product [Choristocarpus tenellus]
MRGLQQLLEVFLPWGNRVIILVSVLLLLLISGISPDVPLSQSTLWILHLIAFSSWFGATVWVTFVAGIVLLNAVDRDTFGNAQAKLLDAFFRFSFLFLAFSIGSAVALKGATTVQTTDEAERSPLLPACKALGVALICVLANLVWIAPKTTKIMFERRRLCKELGVDRKDLNPEVGSGWVWT